MLTTRALLAEQMSGVKRPLSPPSSGRGEASTSSTGAPKRHQVERPSNKVYVGNLHPHVTEANIIQLFRPYGRIIKEQVRFSS